MGKEKDNKEKDDKERREFEVIEALQEDIDKGIVRITSPMMEEMGLSSGDVVKIKGNNSSVAKVMRMQQNGMKKNVIRLDGTTRFNVNSSIGDKVYVSILSVYEAKSVTLSPLQEVRFSDDPTEYFHTKLLHKPLMLNQKTVIDVFGNRLGYIVSKVSPKGAVIVNPSTKIVVSDETHTGNEMKSTGVSYEDIGGLKEEIEQVREMVEMPMKHPEIFQKLGIGAPKGVLMTGPPGTGKTLLAKAVANETDSSFYLINGPEIMSKYYGESEKQLRDTFEKANKNSPAIVFIDEIDSIAPKRGEGTDQTERRVVSQLLSLMDGLKSRGQVVVMAATNTPDDIDPALRRPGRFDRELKINPPGEAGRKEILKIHTRGMPLNKDVDFNELSVKTIGYTGADLEVLCKEAGLKAVKPYFSELKNIEEKVPTSILDKIQVSKNNFLEALKKVEPSAMREVLINKPHVRWSDVGGLNKAKEKLRELVELPLIRPDLFTKAGIKPSKGVLLHGPPGTGKTLLAKAVATECNANFISVKGPELMSKWVGESEKRVREIFSKAKQVAPSIIFFDEFDSISKQRGSSVNDATEKVVNQLLSEMDGVEELEKVMIITATNRKDLIDPALLRPGRIDALVELEIPDKKTREEIFKVHTKGMPLEKNINLSDYINKTEGWTGAEIESIARNAGINAIKRIYLSKDKNKSEKIMIRKGDFDSALEQISEQSGKKSGEQSKDIEKEMDKIKQTLPKKSASKNLSPKNLDSKKSSSKKNTSKNTYSKKSASKNIGSKSTGSKK